MFILRKSYKVFICERNFKPFKAYAYLGIKANGRYITLKKVLAFYKACYLCVFKAVLKREYREHILY